MPAKYGHINFKPTDSMKSEAQKGLAWRKEYGRGGTLVGVARARDIVNGKTLSPSTVKRMFSFFSRHEVDKKAQGFRNGEKGFPSNGRIAWALWGGDAGFSWSRKIVNQMNAADKKEREGMDILKGFKGWFAKNRAVNLQTIQTRFYEFVEKRSGNEEGAEYYEYAYFLDYYMTDTEKYVVYSNRGRIYKLNLTVTNSDIIFEDSPQEIVVEHTPVSRGKTILYRDADNKLRFLGIASSATLNRDGEIDTRAMYDSFEDSFDENDLPPVNLRHVNHSLFEMGHVEGLFRYNNFLVTYGVIDESTPLGAYAEKRLSQGDYGLSIEFVPLASEEIDLNGVKIRTFTKGIFVGLALLPEKLAASNLTGIIIENDEGVSREMALNKKQAKAVLIDFIGDEQVVDGFLNEVDTRESQIAEERMITRSAEEPVEEVVEDTESAEAIIVEIGEVLMQEIDSRIGSSVQAVEENLQTMITEIRSSVLELQASLQSISEIVSRQKATEEEAIQEAVDSLPVNRTQARRAIIRKTVEDISNSEADQVSPDAIANRRMQIVNNAKNKTTSKIE